MLAPLAVLLIFCHTSRGFHFPKNRTDRELFYDVDDPRLSGSSSYLRKHFNRLIECLLPENVDVEFDDRGTLTGKGGAANYSACFEECSLQTLRMVDNNNRILRNSIYKFMNLIGVDLEYSTIEKVFNDCSDLKEYYVSENLLESCEETMFMILCMRHADRKTPGDSQETDE